MNLKYFRENGIEEKLFDCLVERWQELVFPDQDVLNLTLHQSVKKIERKYNYIPMPGFPDGSNETTVIHYAGQKPWEMFFKAAIRDEFWKYYKNCGCITQKQFSFEYAKYKLSNLKIIQLFYVLKLYPLAFFRPEKWSLLKLALS